MAQGCFRHLKTMFQELEECRAFELLKVVLVAFGRRLGGVWVAFGWCWGRKVMMRGLCVCSVAACMDTSLVYLHYICHNPVTVAGR